MRNSAPEPTVTGRPAETAAGLVIESTPPVTFVVLVNELAAARTAVPPPFLRMSPGPSIAPLRKSVPDPKPSRNRLLLSVTGVSMKTLRDELWVIDGNWVALAENRSKPPAT